MRAWLEKVLAFKLLDFEHYKLAVDQVLMVILIISLTYFLMWLFRKFLRKTWKIQDLDDGSYYAIFTIIKYVVWVASITLILESLEIKITFLLAGSAALLVGIGLGLQQIFNDLVSGLILLLEKSIKVGDIIEVDDDVVVVNEINIRTSLVEDRDGVIIILPNSKIVSDKVINWSHQANLTRFRIKVGVSYDADIDQALSILIDSAKAHPECHPAKNPNARILDFGQSSVELELLFWSENLFAIEQTLSEIRKTILLKFRENGISIPFPQRDVHLIQQPS